MIGLNWVEAKKARSKAGLQSDKEKDSLPIHASQSNRKRPALEEVEGLPEHQAKKRRVPQVPNVNFYRTKSKQLIEPGEYVAESDDDVDESWLSQSRDRALEDLGITGEMKDFTRGVQ